MHDNSNQPPFPFWKVWSAATAIDVGGTSPLARVSDDDSKNLSHRKSPSDSDEGSNHSRISSIEYGPLCEEVACVLRGWGHRWAGQNSFQSLLNKSSLLHEVEESIVAIQSLLDWIKGVLRREGSNDACHDRKIQQLNKSAVSEGKDSQRNLIREITVVDVCCGKGIFSMLLSYLAARENDVCRPFHIIKRIIMADKITSKKVNWQHIDVTNDDVLTFTACVKDDHLSEENKIHDKTVAGVINFARVPIEVWGGCNIHDDNFLHKLLSLHEILALVGIHLCKHLGPRLVSLFNTLGKDTAPFMCLAPCCLPRLNRRSSGDCSIEVSLYESEGDRTDREKATLLRDRALGRDTRNACFLCKDRNHRGRDCPSLPLDEPERTRIVRAAAAVSPCWRCGIIGHQKVDCRSEQVSTRPTLRKAPAVTISVSNVLLEKNPFGYYCKILSEAAQGRIEIRETKLVSDASHDQDKNWNGKRKATYILAQR